MWFMLSYHLETFANRIPRMCFLTMTCEHTKMPFMDSVIWSSGSVSCTD